MNSRAHDFGLISVAFAYASFYYLNGKDPRHLDPAKAYSEISNEACCLAQQLVAEELGLTETESPLIHDVICFSCAKSLGGKAPHVFTQSTAVCPYCENEKGVSTITDYHWPREWKVDYVWD